MVAAICPWDYKIMAMKSKYFSFIIPETLTGNCIIVKPLPITPYSNLKLVKVAKQSFHRESSKPSVATLSSDRNWGRINASTTFRLLVRFLRERGSWRRLRRLWREC
ncbi:uncharacterized protein A1O9_11308 [Exophiala aquamarina CBS 119918]|uniref:Aldehyde dehydrogenase domain-containing protein n=1 Tax=Exophiala aquamarina CBS 119918 TaxID=1182545 RepID=A0A072NXX6_9EURO|nr:uncharacterized protein A1O9_11308 [Exophiala aquamarina CBS 119918]KEF52466.1 hypothetical protein A1O9_11308 [Exophiala aquamarina CBS 119918]